MPGSGRREWVTRGRHMLRPGLSGVHGRLLPLRVFSCPCHPERGVMPRLRGKAAQLFFSPALPGPQSHTGSPRTIRKERLLRADSFGRTASPDAKKPPSREKTEVFRIFSEAGAYCTLSLGIPLPMGPYWAS